jgi:NAD-dependent DNA ligase
MQNDLESRGHTVKGSVSGNTDILVIKDMSKGGTKLTKAQDLGIKVYTLGEFKSVASTL